MATKHTMLQSLADIRRLDRLRQKISVRWLRSVCGFKIPCLSAYSARLFCTIWLKNIRYSFAMCSLICIFAFDSWPIMGERCTK